MEGTDVGEAVMGERAVTLDYGQADRCLRARGWLPEQGVLAQGSAGARWARGGIPDGRDPAAKGGRYENTHPI